SMPPRLHLAVERAPRPRPTIPRNLPTANTQRIGPNVRTSLAPSPDRGDDLTTRRPRASVDAPRVPASALDNKTPRSSGGRGGHVRRRGLRSEPMVQGEHSSRRSASGVSARAQTRWNATSGAVLDRCHVLVSTVVTVVAVALGLSALARHVHHAPMLL